MAVSHAKIPCDEKSEIITTTMGTATTATAIVVRRSVRIATVYSATIAGIAMIMLGS